MQQRARDLIGNITVLTPDSKIGCIPVEGDGDHFWQLWTHVLVEMHLRFGPYPKGFEEGFAKELHYPDPRSSISRKAAELIKRIGSFPERYLFKYGKKEHLVRTFQEGMLRLSPASLYDDPSLNSSIQDTELEIRLQPAPGTYKLRVFNGKTLKLKSETNPTDSKLTFAISTDYYVYCVSKVLQPRLFYDFDADSCLVIKRPDEFTKRLKSVVQNTLPTYSFGFGPVSYIDPVLPIPITPELISSKHFRYAYQKEFRFVCLPLENLNTLEALDINLGTLTDCCELLRIDEDK